MQGYLWTSLSTWALEIQFCTSSAIWCCGQPLSFTAYSRWQSCSWGPKSRKSVLAPHLLQQLGEWSCALPEKHSRAGLDVFMWESPWGPGSRITSIIPRWCWKGSTSQGNAGGLVLVVRTREIWQTDQCCNYPDTEPGLWVGQHYLWYAGEREGTDSIDPKLQDLNRETTGYPTGIPFRVHHPQCRKYQKP